MTVKVVSEKEFEDEQKKGGLIMVDFFAQWCPPCKMLGPILEEIDGESNEVRIVKVDIEEQRELAEKNSVTSLPTVILFKDGKEVDKFVGLKQKDEIKEFIQKHS